MIGAARIDKAKFSSLIAGLGLALGLFLVSVVPASPATTGKVQGRILSTDSSEPIGYAQVALVPADSTLKPVGGMTNADGTYLLEAAPGTYRLDIQAMSYTRKTIPDVVVTAGGLVSLSTALTPRPSSSTRSWSRAGRDTTPMPRCSRRARSRSPSGTP